MKVLVNGVVYDSEVTDIFIKMDEEQALEVKRVINGVADKIVLVSHKNLSEEETERKFKEANAFDW